MTPVRVGHYEVVEKIGQGGMGVVYRATDTRLGRPVALKIVSEAFTRDPDARVRLMREAPVAAALNHPSICTIHDGSSAMRRTRRLARCGVRGLRARRAVGRRAHLRCARERGLDGLRFAHAADSRRELRIVRVRDGAAATVAMAGLTGAIADVDWSPRGDRFVVLTEADGRSLLWLVTADGTQTTKIVDEAARISAFTLARDGDAVLFQREAVAGVELAAANLPGGMSAPRHAPTVLVSGVARGPRFSLAADGRTVYYTRELRFSNLWSASLSVGGLGRGASRDGGDNARPMTEGSFLDQYPAVSPDGARVAFVRRAGNSSDVLAVSATGGAPRQVSFLGFIMGAPAWSPEGDLHRACDSCPRVEGDRGG